MSPICPPPHWARDGAFLWAPVPAFLSSGGLKARGGRLPFVLKGPLMQSDERGRAAGKEAAWPWHLCGQGGRHRPFFLRVGLPSRARDHTLAPALPRDPGALAERYLSLRPSQGDPPPGASPTPIGAPLFPQENCCCPPPSTSHAWAGLPGHSPCWQVLANDWALLCQGSQCRDICVNVAWSPSSSSGRCPFSQDLPCLPPPPMAIATR